MTKTELTTKLSQELWAKLLANENIIIREAAVKTASFHMINRILTLPIYKEELPEALKKMFYAHEVGHALFTSADSDYLNKVKTKYKGIIDVVEDARVDNLINIKYPGLINVYRAGHKACYDINLFSINGKNAHSLRFIDRLNLMCKGYQEVHEDNLMHNPIERSLLAQCQAIRSQEENHTLCQKIKEYVEITKEDLNQKLQDMLNQLMDQDDLDGEQAEADESEIEEDESDETSEKPSDEESDETSEKPSDEESDETSEKPSDEESDETSEKPSDEESDLESQTEKSLEKNKELLTENNKRSLLTITVPEYDLSKIVVNPFTNNNPIIQLSTKAHMSSLTEEGEKQYQIMINESKKVATLMAAKFNAIRDAVNEQLGSENTSGLINEQLLYQYKTNDRIFQTYIEQRNEQNHGMVILLDWSESMSEHIMRVTSYLFELIKFCELCRLNLRIYAFTENKHLDCLNVDSLTFTPATIPLLNKEGNNLMTVNHSFRLIELYNSEKQFIETHKVLRLLFSVAANNTNYYFNPLFDYNKFYDCSTDTIKVAGIYSFSGTPMKEGLICMHPIMQQMKQKNDKLSLVLLCDGKDNQRYAITFYRNGKINEVCRPKNILLKVHANTIMVTHNEYVSNMSLILMKQIIEQLHAKVIMIDIVSSWTDYVYLEKPDDFRVKRRNLSHKYSEINAAVKSGINNLGYYIDKQFGRNFTVYAIKSEQYRAEGLKDLLIKKNNKINKSSAVKFFAKMCSQQKVTKVIVHDFIQQIK